jgi:hypothetical protein
VTGQGWRVASQVPSEPSHDIEKVPLARAPAIVPTNATSSRPTVLNSTAVPVIVPWMPPAWKQAAPDIVSVPSIADPFWIQTTSSDPVAVSGLVFVHVPDQRTAAAGGSVAAGGGVATGLALPPGEVPPDAPGVADPPAGDDGATLSLGAKVAGPDPIAPVGDGPLLGSGVAVEPNHAESAQISRTTSPAATRIWRLRIVIGVLRSSLGQE